tara:strand:+ start:288 stop:443 length:156 start_codon:yes stop_codon:yes gene_type:complete
MVLVELAMITIVAEAKAVLFYNRIDAMVRVLHFHISEVGRREQRKLDYDSQ